MKKLQVKNGFPELVYRMSRRIFCKCFVLLLLLASCNNEPEFRIPEVLSEIDLTEAFYCEIYPRSSGTGSFKVLMFVDHLSDVNKVFQFPATVPGVYSIFNVGWFVKSFKAYDAGHNELAVTHPNTNQWVLSKPSETKLIEFTIRATYEENNPDHQIPLMGGTMVQEDHAQVNLFDVLGYPTELEDRDYYINLVYPSEWSVASALVPNEDGLYHASDYATLVDNPFLLGTLTTSTFNVDDCAVSIYTYSHDNHVDALLIKNDIQQVLEDAKEFLGSLRLEEYTFLFNFDAFGNGALEHKYSSLYAFKDKEYDEAYAGNLRAIVAHEFFHTVTPLTLRSEIIDNFNFATPTPSQHLWLYEGVTEWAAHMMQYRNQHLSLTDLLAEFANKATFSNTTYSMTEIALGCYDPGEVHWQYGRVYTKGALIAALLDIRILELSGGTKGLREVINELLTIYDAGTPFSEDGFFATLVPHSYPEINDFIDNYIQGTEALPIAEYFDKIGIYFALNNFSVNPTPTVEQSELRQAWSMNLN